MLVPLVVTVCLGNTQFTFEDTETCVVKEKSNFLMKWKETRLLFLSVKTVACQMVSMIHYIHLLSPKPWSFFFITSLNEYNFYSPKLDFTGDMKKVSQNLDIGAFWSGKNPYNLLTTVLFLLCFSNYQAGKMSVCPLLVY